MILLTSPILQSTIILIVSLAVVAALVISIDAYIQKRKRKKDDSPNNN